MKKDIRVYVDGGTAFKRGKVTSLTLTHSRFLDKPIYCITLAQRDCLGLSSCQATAPELLKWNTPNFEKVKKFRRLSNEIGRLKKEQYALRLTMERYTDEELQGVRPENCR